MTATITSFPSLTTTWTPASSCVTSTGFWYVVYATNVVYSDMFGMPSVTNIGQKSSPTGDCVPESFTLSVPYLTDGDCPASYTKACSSGTTYGTQSAARIMCCPSVSNWDFHCAPATATGAAPYGCVATFTSGDKITGSRTDLLVSTAQAETHTVAGDTGVNAWGIALLSTPPVSTSTSTSSGASNTDSTVTSGSSTSNPTSTTTAASSSGGLSTGASIGIGVGVGVGALVLIGVLAFFFLRHRRRARQQGANVANVNELDPGSALQNRQTSYYGGSQGGMKIEQWNERALLSDDMSSQGGMTTQGATRSEQYEMPAQGAHDQYEMPAHGHDRYEMQG